MSLTKATLHVAATVLILIALALLVIGLQASPLLWQTGLGVVAVAMLMSLGTRWVPRRKDDEPSGRREADDGADPVRRDS